MGDIYTAAETREMNQRWVDSVRGGPAQLEKVAALNREAIRDHIQETSLMRAIKKPEQITDADCTESVNHNSPIIIGEVTDGMWAMPIDFLGSTKNEPVRNGKYAFTINRIQTVMATYDTDELRMVKRPILKMLQTDLGEALSNAEDRAGVVNFETAVWHLYNDYYAGNASNGLNTTNIANGTVREYSVFKTQGAKEVRNSSDNLASTFESQLLRKSDFTNFQNSFNGVEGEQLVGAVAVVSNFDANRVTGWTIEDTGDAKVSASVETTKGYKNLQDFEIVRTGKHRWLRPGNIYGFAPWENLGRYVQLGDVQSWQDTRITRVELCKWFYVGMGLANLMGLKKMETYSASSTPDRETSGYEVVRPKAHDHVIRNHRVDANVWAPRFSVA